MASPQQGVPSFNYPFVDSQGRLTTPWYQFFISLWQRTGGNVPVGNVQSVNVVGEDGIVATVTDSTTTPVITLSLDTITPNAVATSGEVSAGAITSVTGSFSGQMQFGTFIGATPTVTGYVTIKDVSGTSRRLMVGT